MKNELSKKLQNISSKQRDVLRLLKDESLDELHSILRTKQFCEKYLELEMQKETLIDIMVIVK